MYRLYLDEVGTDGLTHVEKDKHRFLSLTGVAMRDDYARDHLAPNMTWIKEKVFGQHPDDEPVILHRRDIMGYSGVFECLRKEETHRRFNAAILRLFSVSQYAVITALIDKEWMLRQRHWKLMHPYHYLMEIIVEKYAQFLERRGAIGDIMPESRQDKDVLLQAAFEEVRGKGTPFVSSQRICSAIRAKNLKFRTKKHNIAGLQLCDLIAHPSHINTRFRMGHAVERGPFCMQVVEILEKDKYDRSGSGKVIGYGIKHLPQ